MARFFDGIKIVKYTVKLGLRLQNLQDPLAELRDAGTMPESLQRLWDISGTQDGSAAPERPDEQPAIVDNTMWYLFDFVRELEKDAPLFDTQYHALIAECVGIAEVLERLLREESDPGELKKWEKKHRHPYEGPTERQKYEAKLQEEAVAGDAEQEHASEPETAAEELSGSSAVIASEAE